MIASMNISAQQIFQITGYTGPICPGKSVVLCAPSGFDTYHWNTGATTKCLTVTAPGTYTVNAMIQNTRLPAGQAGSGFGSIVVQGAPAPPCVIAGDGDICQGTSTVFTATAGFTAYHWST